MTSAAATAEPKADPSVLVSASTCVTSLSHLIQAGRKLQFLLRIAGLPSRACLGLGGRRNGRGRSACPGHSCSGGVTEARVSTWAVCCPVDPLAVRVLAVV